MRCLVGLMGGYFIITAILSITVDPWRINNTPFAIETLDPAREISGTVRVGKAALANRGHWETVILGSSRIEIGLDPAHPAFGGKRTVNLAMSAAHLYETIPAGNYILDRNPQLATLIMGIEAGDLHTDWDSRKFTRFYQSPFADNNRSIERTINQVIGGRALADSIATIRRHASGNKPIRSPLGQWLQPSHPPNLREYTEHTFQMGFESAKDTWSIGTQTLRETKAELLSNFIARVRARGIRMIIIIPPQHALKQIHPTLDKPPSMCWEHDLRAIAQICEKANSTSAKGPPVNLWSFLKFNEFTTRPMPAPNSDIQQIPGWFDLGHSQSSLGDLVIETILSGHPVTDANGATYGVELLNNDWKTLTADWTVAHLAYCKSRSEDVKWWRSLFSSAAEPAQRNSPVTNVQE